jgi:hypothetical protein
VIKVILVIALGTDLLIILKKNMCFHAFDAFIRMETNWSLKRKIAYPSTRKCKKFCLGSFFQFLFPFVILCESVCHFWKGTRLCLGKALGLNCCHRDCLILHGEIGESYVQWLSDSLSVSFSPQCHVPLEIPLCVLQDTRTSIPSQPSVI